MSTAGPGIRRRRSWPPRSVTRPSLRNCRAQYWRKLLWLLDVPDLSRQIVATQRDAEQEAHPGHDPIAVADARAALDEVQLEAAHLVGRRCIGRAFEPGGEPLAAINVAALRVRVERARSHVFDHTLTQRTKATARNR